MNRFIRLVNATLGRRDHGDHHGPADQGEAEALRGELDPWNSYVKVLEEARERRGRLFPRS